MAEISENAEIIERREVSDSLYVLRLRFLEETEFNFTPGQYAELAIPGLLHPERNKLVRRQYSISSIASDNRGVELFISTVPDGIFTPQLAKKKIGDRLWMGEKAKGKFVLGELSSKRLILISTGTGVAPFISMLRSFSAEGNYPWESIVLLQGARKAADLAYHKECTNLRETLPLHYLASLSRLTEEEQSSWPGLTGRVTEVLDSELFSQHSGGALSSKDDTVFLCGNPQMITDACSILEARDLKIYKKKTGGNIHFERYW